MVYEVFTLLITHGLRVYYPFLNPDIDISAQSGHIRNSEVYSSSRILYCSYLSCTLAKITLCTSTTRIYGFRGGKKFTSKSLPLKGSSPMKKKRQKNRGKNRLLEAIAKSPLRPLLLEDDKTKTSQKR